MRLWLRDFSLDVLHALRMIRFRPTVAVTIILTLALGIGATTTMFTVVRLAILDPLPLPDANRLVTIDVFGNYDFALIHERVPSLEKVALLRSIAGVVTEGSSEMVSGYRVTEEFFATVGVELLHGRPFTKDEWAEDLPGVVLLSHSYWQLRFGGSTDVLGRTIPVAGFRDTTYVMPGVTELVVVGILPPQLDAFQSRFTSGRADVWVPYNAAEADLMQVAPQVIGKLREPASFEQLQTELDGIANLVGQYYPQYVRASNRPLRAGYFLQVYRNASRTMVLYLFMGAVGLIMAAITANVATLLLAQALSRVREWGVRTALGATRSRLIRQSIAEIVVLTSIGSVAAMLVAAWSTGLLIGFLPETAGRIREVQLDPGFFAAGLGIAILTAAGCSVLSVTRLSSILGAVNGSSSSVLRSIRGPGLGQAAGWLTIAQISAAVALLACSGLFIRSLSQAMQVPLGFDPAGIVVGDTYGMRLLYHEDYTKHRAFREEAKQRLLALPGVQSVSFAGGMPFQLTSGIGSFREQDRTEYLRLSTVAVDQHFFEVMSLVLKEGRNFAPEDFGTETPTAVIVNESTARSMWPGVSPVGRQLRRSERNPPLTVIGVVRDSHMFSGMDADAQELLYMPILNKSASAAMMYVRTTGDTSLGPLRQELHAVDPELPIPPLRMMTDWVADAYGDYRSRAILMASFAGLATAVALVGVFGLMRHAIAGRMREFAIRMALGASAQHVVWLILKHALAVTVPGIGAGLIIAVGSIRFLDAFLFKVEALDWVTLMGVGVLFVSVTLGAIAVPIWKAVQGSRGIALQQD